MVVEGYVDVIAMVGAGFPASVAPLGTALTENQLALLWKMADEPILCFDGDKAGQKAAWRAADLALPHLKPGKSLRFALLPEGQDPDDLARSGGRGAIEEVISAARGLADVIWSREIEGGTLRHPGAARGAGGADRRTRPMASATRWCGAIIARIWPSACSGRSRRKPRAAAMPEAAIAERAISAANQAGALPPRGSFTPGAAGRFASRRRGGRARARPAARPSTAGPIRRRAPSSRPSPIMRGQRSAISRREALILQSLINHPWLLHDHLEEVAALELAHPEAHKLRAGIIAAFANDHHHSPEPAEQSRENAGRPRIGRIFANPSKG